MNPEERIATWRTRCLERKATNRAWRSTATRLIDAESLRRSEGLPWQIRRGQLVRARFEAADFAIDDVEFLIGRMAPDAPTDEQTLAAADDYLATFGPNPGQTGHCELDLSRLFELGVDGLLNLVRERRGSTSGDAADVHQSFIDVLKGFSTMIERAANVADSAKSAAGTERQAELDMIVESCRHIAHKPPKTFRDAVQLLWLTIMATMYGDGVGLVVPGRIDQSPHPFYQRDLDSGIMDQEGSLLLLESLYLQINEFVPNGLAMSVMVGGRDENGNDLTNPLSHLCLEALRRTRLVYPTVGVCWHEGTPESLTKLAVELIAEGLSTPAFFNDEVIQRGLRMYGATPSEACRYINSTCVEITPIGSSNVWVASPYFSLCEVLIEEIDEQVENHREASNFDDFLHRYHHRLGERITTAVETINGNRRLRRLHGRKPFQSLFTNDCLERGRDIDDGGARHNWVECSFVGMANLADSLMVIKSEIFDSENLTLDEMKAILDVDFEGFQSERTRFLERPKYGNDEPDVDDLLRRTADFIRGECAKHRVAPDGSPFIPGAFCWIMHERLGSTCGATPDGRRRGQPFADGGGPAQGRETRGPTAAIKSTTSWDHAFLIGGLAYNMKFNSSLFKGPEATNRLRDLIVTFLRLGGFETQINVVDHETLRRAEANPENYRDLVVRVGGYTDYFTRLSPEMRREVMARTEFGIV